MSIKKVMVFGAGLIGGFIANRLSKKYKVTACDGDINRLNKLDTGIDRVAFLCKNKDDISYRIELGDPDIIVNAFPGHLGYDVLKMAVESGKDIVDISFMPENPTDPILFKKAVKNGVTAVVDFGFAPGMCHMFVSRANKLLNKHYESVIYVGGLQIDSDDYKAVFSPVDVIQEYIRPARYTKDYKVVTEEPFENNYEYELQIGDHNVLFSGFISDGLRTLLRSLDLPNVIEITLRTPKHFEFIRRLKENGFFKKEHLENTSKILVDAWKMTEEDRDFSILYVTSKGDDKEITHYMYDKYDEETKTHSMARATGLPAIAMVEAILEGKYTEKGVIPPEYVAKNDEIYNYIVEYLEERGIVIIEEETESTTPQLKDCGA
jgi:lysine 6-dehydrogenase